MNRNIGGRHRAVTAWCLVVSCVLGTGGCSLPALPHAPTGGTVTVSGELKTSVFEDALAHDRWIIVKYSPGGSGASALALSRVKSVVIDGPCKSACAWAFLLSEHACFTRRAAFGFHASHDPGTGNPMPEVTRYWLAITRPGLRPAIQKIETSSRVIPVALSMMRQHYGDRECRGAGRRGVTENRNGTIG